MEGKTVLKYSLLNLLSTFWSNTKTLKTVAATVITWYLGITENIPQTSLLLYCRFLKNVITVR